MKTKILFTYTTPISVVEKDQNISLGVKPEMALGDYFKKSGFPSLSDLMKR